MPNSTLCASSNTESIDQSSFWNPHGVNWDAHRIGWVVSGSCAVVTIAGSFVTIMQHCLHYTIRAEQRQIIRILFMPIVYSVMSFLSYRFFRSYTYFVLVEAVYQSITLGAFLLLLLEYAGGIDRKEKQCWPFPLCFWRYRPTKAYFIHIVKWLVLQYIIFQPLLTIAAVIAQAEGSLCESGWSFRSARPYFTIVQAVSSNIAGYALDVIFALFLDKELKGRRPRAKKWSMTLVIQLVSYQSLILGILQGRVIHATQYWTESNIANGINALLLCGEMVLITMYMAWAYSWREYKIPGAPKTNPFRPLWDSINYSDFAIEIIGVIKYFFTRSHPGSHDEDHRSLVVGPDGKLHKRPNFEDAFGFSAYEAQPNHRRQKPSRSIYEEDIRLAPYTYGARGPSHDRSW